MGSAYHSALLMSALVLASSATAQPAGQKVTGPVATYWMSTQTQTGFGMGGMGGGGPQHMLTLQLVD